MHIYLCSSDWGKESKSKPHRPLELRLSVSVRVYRGTEPGQNVLLGFIYPGTELLGAKLNALNAGYMIAIV